MNTEEQAILYNLEERAILYADRPTKHLWSERYNDYIEISKEQQKIDIEKAGYAHCKCCAFFNKNCKGQDKDCSDYKAFKQTMEE